MERASLRFFEQEAIEYDTMRNKAFLFKAKASILSVIVQTKSRRTFLEVGAGTGEVFKELANNFQMAIASDISHNMLVLARQKLGKHATIADFVVADAQHLPFKRRAFDLLICMDVMEHIENPSQCINEVLGCISDVGLAAITTPNPIWAFILYIAEKLRLKVREGPHRYIFLTAHTRELSRMTSTEYIGSLVFFPIKTPIDSLLERTTKVPFVKMLGFSQLILVKRIVKMQGDGKQQT